MKLQSRAWLTSFGDLLTLLLCFIVLAVCQSAKQGQQKNQSNQTLKPAIETSIEQADSYGKQIASNLVTESPHLALALVKDDFETTYSALSENGIHRIQAFAEQVEGGLEMGVCNVGFDFSESVFEVLANQLAPRILKWTIGSEVCINLNELGSKTLEDTILLSANVKQSHG